MSRIVLRQINSDWIRNGDLASVFAALHAAHHIDASFITGEHLSAVVERLTSCEVTIGGPYKNNDGTIEPVANAYISASMSWMAEPLPQVLHLLQQLPSYYSVTADDLPLYLVLDTASSALITTEYQQELLSAIAVSVHSFDKKEDTIKQHYGSMADEIYTTCRKNITENLPEPLASLSLKMFENVRTSDDNYEISLLPYFYAAALCKTTGALIDAPLCHSLGVANMYAWMAYTTYDDFLDGAGEPIALSIAHTALRMMQEEYRQVLSTDAEFQAFIRQSMIMLDAANTQEIAEHRFNVSKSAIHVAPLRAYGQCELLANRAIMHIAGPMAVLKAHDNGTTASEHAYTLQAFKHYLIARQVSDDIQDWADDLQKGHISCVVAELLRDLRLQPGVYLFRELMPLAKQCFWRTTLPRITHMALEQIGQARASFATAGLILADTDALNALLVAVEQTLKEAQVSTKQAREFIQKEQGSSRQAISD